MTAIENNVPSDPALKIISILSDLYDRELVSTIGWAKQIPGTCPYSRISSTTDPICLSKYLFAHFPSGFTDLSLNDQMRLLQSTWAEILTLTMAYRSMNYCNGKLRFAGDFVLDERQAKECGAVDIFHLVRPLLRAFPYRLLTIGD